MGAKGDQRKIVFDAKYFHLFSLADGVLPKFEAGCKTILGQNFFILPPTIQKSSILCNNCDYFAVWERRRTELVRKLTNAASALLVLTLFNLNLIKKVWQNTSLYSLIMM